MRACFILLMMVFGSGTFSQEPFRLHISFTKHPGDSVKLVYNKKVVTVPSQGNEAVIEGETTGSNQASLSVSGSNCLLAFYLEPGNIEIKAEVFTIDEGKICISKKEVKGSHTEALMKKFNDDVQKTRRKYEPAFASRKIKEMAIDIIKKNPSKSFSTDIVMSLHRELGNEWALEALELIDDKAKGNAVSYVNKAMLSSALLQKGNIIDFTQPSTEDSFTLSGLRGKYVLLDFWASWCAPCRKENPSLVKLYEKYHDLGFEIVGISLDTDNEKWREAIEKDGLPWIHVSDLKGWQNNVSSTLGINAIPSAILLDREGKIIDYGLRGNELERAVERLFNNKD